MDLFQKILPFFTLGLAIFTVAIIYLDNKKDSAKKSLKK